MFNYKTLIIIVCTAILTWAILSQFRCNGVPKPVVVKTQEIKKEIQTAAVDYKALADSLSVTEKALKRENETLQIKLLVAQGRVRTASKTAIKITKADVSDHTAGDYVSNIDSIKAVAVMELIDAAYESDSICNANITNLNQQIVNKDSSIKVKDDFIGVLKSSTNTLLDNQAKLEQYGKDMRKDIRRRKFGAFIWKGVSAVLAALVIYISVK